MTGPDCIEQYAAMAISMEAFVAENGDNSTVEFLCKRIEHLRLTFDVLPIELQAVTCVCFEMSMRITRVREVTVLYTGSFEAR